MCKYLYAYYVERYLARIVAESSRKLRDLSPGIKDILWKFIVLPLPPSNVSMSVLTVIVIVIVTTYKSSLCRKKRAPSVRVRGTSQGKFKGK